MSIFTVLAIILPILGGFIAWAGDIIGYRLGKSRRSLLGLRPRSTARLIAVVVGVVLPVVTMALAAVGSENVRIALFRLTELTQQRAQLEVENKQLAASAESSKQQKETAQRQYEAARKGLAAAQVELRSAETSLRGARAELNAARAERQRLLGQVQELKTSRDRLQEELSKAQADLATSLTALAQKNQELRQAEKQVQALDAQARDLQEMVRRETLRVEQKQREVENKQRELDQTTAELQDKRDELEATKQMKAAIEALWGWHEDVAGANPVLYEPGAELVRGTINARQSLGQIEASLQELVVLAAKNAAARGVQPPEGQSAAQLVMPLTPAVEPGLPAEEDIIRLVAETIRSGPARQYVTVIRAVFRSFAGDRRPVAASLFVRPNDLVYPQGTVIVHKIIDGSRPRPEVFQRLWGLLGELRAAAERAGLMRDPQSGQYGQVPAESILRALDELLAHETPLEVYAVAAEDVYVASENPFLVLLRVEQPEETPQ